MCVCVCECGRRFRRPGDMKRHKCVAERRSSGAQCNVVFARNGSEALLNVGVLTSRAGQEWPM